jgi:hypothetical protein
LNVIYRTLGELLCLEALTYAVGIMGLWNAIHPQAKANRSQSFLLQKMILLGVGVFVAYELIYFTSLASFRRYWDELFLGLHLFLQIAALILIFFYHRSTRNSAGIALAIFFINRICLSNLA